MDNECGHVCMDMAFLPMLCLLACGTYTVHVDSLLFQTLMPTTLRSGLPTDQRTALSATVSYGGWPSRGSNAPVSEP